MELRNKHTGQVIKVDEASEQRGGRSSVYAVAGQPELLAKVVAPSYRSERRRRKVAEVRARLKGFGGNVAAPLDELVDEKRAWCGYLMRAVKGPRLDAVARQQGAPLSLRLRLAQMFAKEVERLNRRGIVVGDLALENAVFCEAEGKVYLIDADGFQVFGTGAELFGAEEAHLKSREMTSFGLDGKRPLSMGSDGELLAVAVHQLLFGRDPYYSFAPDVPAAAARLHNQRNYVYAYAQEEGRLPLNAAGTRVELLFWRAFTTPDPPLSREWVAVLDLAVKTGLLLCGCNNEFPADLPACPFCGARNRNYQATRNFGIAKPKSPRAPRRGAGASAVQDVASAPKNPPSARRRRDSARWVCKQAVLKVFHAGGTAASVLTAALAIGFGLLAFGQWETEAGVTWAFGALVCAGAFVISRLGFLDAVSRCLVPVIVLSAAFIVAPEACGWAGETVLACVFALGDEAVSLGAGVAEGALAFVADAGNAALTFAGSALGQL